MWPAAVDLCVDGRNSQTVQRDLVSERKERNDTATSLLEGEI